MKMAFTCIMSGLCGATIMLIVLQDFRPTYSRCDITPNLLYEGRRSDGTIECRYIVPVPEQNRRKGQK